MSAMVTKPYTPSPDVLFSTIESHFITPTNPVPSLGRVLDAGTGVHSMKWLVRLEEMGCLTSWDAVTADQGMRRSVETQLKAIKEDSIGEVIIGNWASSTNDTGSTQTGYSVKNGHHGQTVSGRMYDTIILDYLIGSIDGFSPYFQDLIIPRIKRHLNPGGKMFVVGLQPIEDKIEGKGNIVAEVRRARDAAILLAGHRCYREYPLSWVTRTLLASSLTPISSRKFPILYSHASIVRQINVGRSKIVLMDEGVREGMKGLFDGLEKKSEEATREGKIKVGFDYVVGCQREEGDKEDLAGESVK